MPDPYRATRPRLKADILAWVEAGTSLAAICAKPDMPSDLTIARWRRADDSFDQLLTQALNLGRYRRRWTFDPARAQAFLLRYAQREPLADLWRDPALPGRTEYRRWLILHPPFAEDVHRLKLMHAAVRRDAIAARRRPRPFDQAIADRLLYRVGQGQPLKTLHKADPSFPTPKMVARWRAENPDFDFDLTANLAWGRGRRPHAAPRRRAAVADLILARVAAGASFTEAVRSPGLPSPRTLTRWLAADPAFAQRMHLACTHRDHMLIDQLQRLAECAGPGTVGEVRRLMGPVSARLGRLRRWGERRGERW